MEDAVPAIVDPTIFEEVQQHMADNRKSQAATRPVIRREYPLRGKVFCAGCKTAMTIQVSRGKYEHSHCTGRRRKHDCDMPPSVPLFLEARVAEAVRSLLGDPEQVESLLAILREQGDKAKAGAGDRLAALHAQVSASALSEEKLLEALALITSTHGDPAALLSIVARVEVDRDDITVWTILDAALDAPADAPETKSQGTPGGAPCTYNSWWSRGAQG